MTDNVSHVYPEDSEPEHKLDGFCWCQPLVEDVAPEGRIYIHRRSLDSPHIEAGEVGEPVTPKREEALG
jgi:hypothetical protein